MRRFLDVEGAAKCTFGRRSFCRVFSVTGCHDEDVSTARVASSSEVATAPATTLEAWRALEGRGGGEGIR